MKILTAIQVRKLLKSDPEIRLVMVLGNKAYEKAHIPGSINISNIEDARIEFPRHTKIIVYCSDHACVASYQAYLLLENAGYKNIWRFAGGLREWSDAGYELNTC